MVFDKLKDSLMKSIENNSYKTKLTYKDKDGVEHEEEVYLKRGLGKLGDWHQAYLPVKDDGSNKWNIANAFFGGTRNLLKLLAYIAIFLFFTLAIKEAYSNYEVLRNLPCVQSCLNLIGYG